MFLLIVLARSPRGGAGVGVRGGGGGGGFQTTHTVISPLPNLHII